MNHFEKTYPKAALLILALTVSGCAGGFSPSGAVSFSGGANSLASSGSGSSGGGLAGLANSSAITTAISTALGVANSLASNATFGPCSGNGPSSQTMTANYTGSAETVTTSTLLTYSGGSCSPLSSNQITIAPTVNAAMTDGDNFSLTSSPSTNYLGQSIGGGIQVNYNILGDSGSANVLGLHAVTTGSVATDISIHSSSAIDASLSLSAPYFSLTNAGGFVVDDNTDQLSLALAGNGLVWSSSTCGCPVGGSLNGTISGSQTGTVSVTFGSTCGSVSLNALGVSSTVTVAQCQLSN
jgi:hypothetical protein